MTASTRIQVVITVDHDVSITDEELHAAVAEALPGMTLIAPTGTGRASAVIDDIETVWVMG
jgi:hypothetical protein